MTQGLHFAVCAVFALAAAVAAGPVGQEASAQEASTRVERAPVSVVVVGQEARRGQEGLGLGKVGAELAPAPAARSRRPVSAERYVAAQTAAQAAAQQRQDEVTIGEFKRGALIGGAAGVVAGALVGVALADDSNPRWETALPVAMAGLAVGAPTGVYLGTGSSSRYFWGAAGAAGAVAAGTAVYLIEAR